MNQKLRSIVESRLEKIKKVNRKHVTLLVAALALVTIYQNCSSSGAGSSSSTQTALPSGSIIPTAPTNSTSASPLTFATSTSSLITGESFTFSATGGVPPYSYSSTSGFISTSTGLYTVPFSINSASDTVTVTDAQNTSITNSVSLRAFQTVDQFQYGADTYSVPSALAFDSYGNLYAVGTGESTSNTTTWIVRKSSNGGSSWITVDAFNGGNNDGQAKGIAVNSAGTIFVVGISGGSWAVRSSPLGGTVWTTIDSLSGPSYASSSAQAVAVDPSGNIYVAGIVTPAGATSGTDWVVKRSTNGGGIWSVVDTFQLVTGFISSPNAIAINSQGAVYVAGSGNNIDGPEWLVRETTNGGTTWNTVDTYLDPNGLTSQAWSITIDPAGNLYTLGWSSANGNWTVRKSTDSGNSWSLLNTATTKYATGQSIATDIAGNVFIAGSTFYNNPNTSSSSCVRFSKDGGSTWESIDNFQLISGQASAATAVTASASGGIYVVASGATTTASYWLTRFLSPP